METPYQGRAIINECFDGVEITIPAKRNWFLVIILFFGWAAGRLGRFLR